MAASSTTTGKATAPDLTNAARRQSGVSTFLVDAPSCVTLMMPMALGGTTPGTIRAPGGVSPLSLSQDGHILTPPVRVRGDDPLPL